MNKIILKDETELEIEESSNADLFRKVFSDPQEYLETLVRLNSENLSMYQIQTSEGLTVANPKNKECLTQTVKALWNDDGTLNGLDVIFNLANVDMVAKAIKDLQEGQEMNTNGIIELADIVGGRV